MLFILITQIESYILGCSRIFVTLVSVVNGIGLPYLIFSDLNFNHYE